MPIDPDARVFAPDTAATIASLADRYRVVLADSLTVGGIAYTEATLRDLTARDLLDAQEASERVTVSGGTVTLVSSPARMGIELLRRQIARLTDGSAVYHGPLSREELGRLSIPDLKTVQQAADALDVITALRAGEAAEGRGRNTGGDA